MSRTLACMANPELTLPPPLDALYALQFVEREEDEDEDDDEEERLDFEVYEKFQSPAEMESWIRAWTGNQELSGAEYRMFGQDGTGGLVGFWIVREGAELLDQPVVFFGSEGETGVLAADFADFLWLLAAGLGPYEANAYRKGELTDNPRFLAFAVEHAKGPRREAAAVLRRARGEFPRFSATIQALCR